MAGNGLSNRAKLKPKFRPFKADQNKIKTHKIAAMLFCFVFLCLFWRFSLKINTETESKTIWQQFYEFLLVGFKKPKFRL